MARWEHVVEPVPGHLQEVGARDDVAHDEMRAAKRCVLDALSDEVAPALVHRGHHGHSVLPHLVSPRVDQMCEAGSSLEVDGSAFPAVHGGRDDVEHEAKVLMTALQPDVVQ